jgi:predicted ATPase
MQFGICVMANIDEIGFFAHAERLGYDSVWVADSQMLFSDCYAVLAPYFCTMLADVAAHLGDPADGLEALAEALILVEQHDERWWKAEVHRLRGVLLLRQPETPQAEAEDCFQHALTVAHRQEAKSLELRAAISLARLWQQQGKGQEAHDLLAPIYGWFTEGFDTADLQEARALLETLREEE